VRRRAVLLVLLVLVAGTGSAARAGDSPSECAAAEAAWQEDFRYVTEAQVYSSMGDGYVDLFVGYLAAIVPAVGLEVERGNGLPAATISWSASLPFGPVTACGSSRHSRNLYELRTLRAVLEGGVVIRSPAWPYLRPGLRAIWHRSTWPLGIGAGVGSTLAHIDNAHAAASLSPELLLHYGSCCAPGYWLLTLRGDVFFPRREPATAVASVTFAFW
jgi:hypothetical protein